MEQNEIKDLIDHATWDKWHDKAVKTGNIPKGNSVWCDTGCFFACFDKSKKTLREHDRWACHAPVTYQGYTHNYVYPQDKTEEMLRPYLQWLVNESPFAEIFLSKNVERIIEKGFVVDDTKHKGLVLGGLIATRFTWEHGLHALVWWELVKAGCNKDYAYIVACSHKALTHPVTGFVKSFVSHGGIDTTTWDKSAVKAWMTHTPARETTGANKTFWGKSCTGKDVYEDFGIPEPKSSKVKSGFSSVECYSVEDFVNHYAAYEEEFVRHVVPDYVSGVKIVIEKPKPPMVEPEGDM